ncbi:MAG: hypothetical protein IT445_10935 [Phycisphaeraceae bacterium]|nr:hypothetical protein [Phycisphaeraceae bacterium]
MKIETYLAAPIVSLLLLSASALVLPGCEGYTNSPPANTNQPGETTTPDTNDASTPPDQPMNGNSPDQTPPTNP